MPRFTTSELRDVDPGSSRTIKIKEEPQDVTVRDHSYDSHTTVAIKDEPLDEVGPLQYPATSISRYQGRKRSVEHDEDHELVDDIKIPPEDASIFQHPAKKRKLRGQTETCATCLDEFEVRRLTQFPCHCAAMYCRECLDTWYAMTLQSKEFPRCCGREIIDNHVFDVLSTKTKRRYTDVLEEKDKTEIQNIKPLYCQSCRQYIRSSQIKDAFGTCPSCKKKSCVECGQLRSEHRGIYNICPTYLNDPALAHLGPNFQRCPKCYRMIEKASGCDELRCKCGCKFRFCCGTRKCDCRPLPN